MFLMFLYFCFRQKIEGGRCRGWRGRGRAGRSQRWGLPGGEDEAQEASKVSWAIITKSIWMGSGCSRVVEDTPCYREVMGLNPTGCLAFFCSLSYQLCILNAGPFRLVISVRAVFRVTNKWPHIVRSAKQTSCTSLTKCGINWRLAALQQHCYYTVLLNGSWECSVYQLM